MIAIEFSRPVNVERMGGDTKLFDIVASADECLALSKRYKILSVEGVSARIELSRVHGATILLRGRLIADVVQACVVTLDPVAAHIEEEFEMTFAPPEEHGEEDDVIDLDAPDPPDPIENGVIDIGEATAGHLALALDPFPRVPGAVFEHGGDGAGNPAFAALAALTKK